MSTERQQFKVWADAVHKLMPYLMIDCNTLDDLEAFLRARAQAPQAQPRPDTKELKGNT